MKYIRTKDEIYSLEKATIFRYKNKEYVCPIRREETFEEHRSREYQFISPKWEVIKVADTIDELFDEYVFIENNYPTLLEELNAKNKTFLRKNEYEFLSALPKEPIIYGAIWTNNGLIYKARMKNILPNGEIDWELL